MLTLVVGLTLVIEEEEMEGVTVAKIEPIGMERLEGTKTFENINKALNDEATSVVRYLIYADKAEDAMVKKFFEQAAGNEMEHAKVMLKLLGALGEEVDNLKKSFSIEAFVSKIEYPSMAEIAREEGFEDVATRFEGLATIEARHRDGFKGLLDAIEKGTLYKTQKRAEWHCTECGYVHIGTEPPEKCPVCGHDKDDYELL